MHPRTVSGERILGDNAGEGCVRGTGGKGGRGEENWEAARDVVKTRLGLGQVVESRETCRLVKGTSVYYNTVALEACL